MDYHVVLRPVADRALGKLPRDVQSRVITKAQSLAANPRPHGAKKLQGATGNSISIAWQWATTESSTPLTMPVAWVTVTIIADRKESYRRL